MLKLFEFDVEKSQMRNLLKNDNDFNDCKEILRQNYRSIFIISRYLAAMNPSGDNFLIT